MNKKLMALAVASALAAPGLAVAQVSVTPTAIVPSPGIASSGGITLYGRLDETIVSNQFSDAGTRLVSKVKKGDVWSAGNAMGIRGREDLGGGTSAFFQLEIGVWPSERLDTATITGNNWGGRNSAIGFSSGVGDIFVGIWDTPYKQVYGVWNSVTSGGFSAAGITLGNGDTTGALNNTLCQGTISNTTGSLAVVPPALNSCVTEATANGTAWSRRISNSVQYWTPVMAGFQAKFMTAMANYQSPGTNAFASGLPKPKEYSASLAWVRGPISLGLGYDYHEGLRPNQSLGANANPKDNAVQVGAKWNFGPGEIGAAYEKISYGENGTSASPAGKMDLGSYAVNGRWNIGPGAVWGSYTGTDGGKSCSTNITTIGSAACGVKAKMYALGYDYVLSKRTKLYVAYNKIDNGVTTVGSNIIGTNYYYIAGPAGNNANGTASGIILGTDVTTVGVGLQHVF